MIEQDLQILHECKRYFQWMTRPQKDMWQGCWQWVFIHRQALTNKQLTQLERAIKQAAGKRL